MTYRRKIADEILPILKNLAKDHGPDLFRKVVELLYAWFVTNRDQARPVYQAAQQIPLAGGYSPFASMSLEQYYSQINAAQQQYAYQYKQYFDNLMQRALNYWLTLPYPRKQAFWQQAQYNQGYPVTTNDQFMSNLLILLLTHMDRR